MKNATKTIVSRNQADTISCGETLGRKLRGKEIIELIGDIGSGKTTFIKGLAKGVGSQDLVTSPTFTLKQKYKGRINLNHYDFYRLDDAGIMKHEIGEINSDEVVVVEWAETVGYVLPNNRVRVKIEPTDKEQRRINIYLPAGLQYLR